MLAARYFKLPLSPKIGVWYGSAILWPLFVGGLKRLVVADPRKGGHPHHRWEAAAKPLRHIRPIVNQYSDCMVGTEFNHENMMGLPC